MSGQRGPLLIDARHLRADAASVRRPRTKDGSPERLPLTKRPQACGVSIDCAAPPAAAASSRSARAPALLERALIVRAARNDSAKWVPRRRALLQGGAPPLQSRIVADCLVVQRPSTSNRWGATLSLSPSLFTPLVTRSSRVARPVFPCSGSTCQKSGRSQAHATDMPSFQVRLLGETNLFTGAASLKRAHLMFRVCNRLWCSW